jgi:hypothetical protein
MALPLAIADIRRPNHQTNYAWLAGSLLKLVHLLLPWRAATDRSF